MSSNTSPKINQLARLSFAMCIALSTLACGLFGETQSDEETARQLSEAATNLPRLATEFARLQTEAPEEVTKMVSRVQTAEALVKEFESGVRNISDTVSSVISQVVPLLPIGSETAILFAVPLESATEAPGCSIGQICAAEPNYHTGQGYWGGPKIVAAGPGRVVQIQANHVGCPTPLTRWKVGWKV